MSDDTLIVEVKTTKDTPKDVVHIRRLINTRELTGLDLDLDGDIQYFEVTRYTKVGDRLQQWQTPTHVHVDPTAPDARYRLAFLALEATHEGESRDDAWLDAKRETDDEIEEIVEQKDAFINKQSGIIIELMAVLNEAKAWKHVPDDLYEELRNYV